MPHTLIRTLGLTCLMAGCGLLAFGCAHQPTHCVVAAKAPVDVPFAPPPKPLGSTLRYQAGVAHFDEHPVGAAVEVGGYQPAFVRTTSTANAPAGSPAKRMESECRADDPLAPLDCDRTLETSARGAAGKALAATPKT